ncbi:MAG: oxygen-independent coproporphyrinogen III oxidase [Elusimicrobia bacterium HGW-Elusimicrobia-1]|jgi:oxygen-independent coproporphyrinogen-3 oxidase|nr:MAG: oxygen-independent coproporphyrinogen III oxidase [Elusimicrobia bacterium HGW-Elusimicrobia-1]
MTNKLSSLDPAVINKYGVYAFDYIEYPHKSFWSNDFGDAAFRGALVESFPRGGGASTALYVHIPFCPQKCSFCICHADVTSDHGRIRRYLTDSLYPELKLLSDFISDCGLAPGIREIYVGGGSPTMLEEKDFEGLLERIRPLAPPENIADFNIEVDPRRVPPERMSFYISRGVNRMSFGIQDFDPAVQRAVNRIQPPGLIEKLLTPDVRAKLESINFDVLCGLPGQTEAGIVVTMKKVVELSPDRISFAFMHYAPKNAKHQLMMKVEDIPDFFTKRKLFAAAIEVIEDAGYVRTGFEHFAKAHDAVAMAVAAGRATYNSLGATSGRSADMLGVGRHSYSAVGDYYFQNVYEQEKYESELRLSKFPKFRGFRLNADDKIRRNVIKNLRTYFYIDIAEEEKNSGVDFARYFAKELAELGGFASDGLLEMSPGRITLSEIGKYFAPQVCRVFDKYAASGVDK